MKNVKISFVFELSPELEALSKDELQRKMDYLLADAVGEFCASRKFGNEQAYVDKRYPFYDSEEKARKVEEVRNRCMLARDMHNGVLRAQIEDITEGEG